MSLKRQAKSHDMDISENILNTSTILNTFNTFTKNKNFVMDKNGKK